MRTFFRLIIKRGAVGVYTTLLLVATSLIIAPAASAATLIPAIDDNWLSDAFGVLFKPARNNLTVFIKDWGWQITGVLLLLALGFSVAGKGGLWFRRALWAAAAVMLSGTLMSLSG